MCPHGGLAIPTEDFTGKVERYRSGRGHDQTKERLDSFLEILTEAGLEGRVVATVEPREACGEGVQPAGIERSFAQPFRHETQVEHHTLALLHQQVAECFTIVGREQGTDLRRAVSV